MTTDPDQTFERQHHIPEDEDTETLQQLALGLIIVGLLVWAAGQL